MPGLGVELFGVVLVTEVGDEVFAHPVAQRVLQLRLLDEDVVLRIQPSADLRALEVEATAIPGCPSCRPAARGR